MTFSPSAAWPSLTRNAAAVPGGLWTAPMPAPFFVNGVRWEPADAECASIGYALAKELIGAGDAPPAEDVEVDDGGHS